MKMHAAGRWLLCALVLAVAVTPALAQSSVKANVPFNFVVRSQVMNAGEYTLVKLNQLSWIIQSTDGQARPIIVAAGLYAAGEPSNRAKLVFHRYGDEYFLSEIWMGNNTVGRRIPLTKRETQLARESKPPEVATQLASSR